MELQWNNDFSRQKRFVSPGLGYVHQPRYIETEICPHVLEDHTAATNQASIALLFSCMVLHITFLFLLQCKDCFGWATGQFVRRALSPHFFN